MPEHAKPMSRRDHLWVLAVIAAFALYDVWGAWTELGNKSGFAHGTGWTLTVIVELYWGYALYAWLGATPGRRSRRFATWTAGGVFLLSLIGQGASHLTAHTVPPPMVVVFVSTLPVIVLALVAILVHLRHIDRAEAVRAEAVAAAERERIAAEVAEADERVALRAQLASLREDAEAELDALRVEMSAAETARNEAQQEAELATAKIERLTRKLAAGPGAGRGRNGRSRQPANGGRRNPATGANPHVPRDVDARAEALALLSENPAISGAKLGEAVGKSERWGQLLKSELATVPADPEEPR